MNLLKFFAKNHGFRFLVKFRIFKTTEVDTSWERTTARLKTLERDHIRLDELVKIFNIPDPQERHNAIMGYTRQKKSDQTASTQAVNMARANISRFSKELKEADNPAYVPVTSEVEKI